VLSRIEYLVCFENIVGDLTDVCHNCHGWGEELFKTRSQMIPVARTSPHHIQPMLSFFCWLVSYMQYNIFKKSYFMP